MNKLLGNQKGKEKLIILGILSIFGSLFPIVGFTASSVGIKIGLSQFAKDKSKIVKLGLILNVIGFGLSLVSFIFSFYMSANKRIDQVKYKEQTVELQKNNSEKTADQSRGIPSGTFLFVDKSQEYQIFVPNGWTTDESDIENHVFINPVRTFVSDGVYFSSNIAISSENANGGLDDWVQSNKLAFKIFADYKLIEDKRILLSGRSTMAHLLVATYTQDEIPAKQLLLTVIKNNKAYLLSGTMLQSQVEEQESLMRKSLMSFQVF